MGFHFLQGEPPFLQSLGQGQEALGPRVFQGFRLGPKAVHPHPVPFLRQVHQVEVMGKGPHQGLGLLEGKPLHPLQKGGPRSFVPLSSGLG